MFGKKENRITLKSIVLVDVKFNRAIKFDPSKEKKQRMLIDVESNISGPKKFAVYLNVDFKLENPEGIIMDVFVKYAGLFESEEDGDFESFININAPAIIFPFIREEISSLTSKSQAGTVLLQPVNFVALYEQKKKETNGK